MAAATGWPGGSKSFAQVWSLDKLGNWAGFKHDATGAGWTFEQERSHNLANELGTIDGGGWVSPVHDAAGNTTQFPKAGSEGTRLHAVYDAWNRLVEVRQDSGGSAGALVVSYRYDGLNQRVRRLVAGGDSFDFYFNESWQVLEVRRNGDTDPLEQWVWDVRYVDAPAVLFRDSNTDGSVDDTLYVTQDANFNVTGLVNAATGAVVERYAYSPYGQRSVMDASFGARGSSSYEFPLGHQGGRWDELAGVYDFRNRVYHPTAGRWLTRDPLGYVDGMNRYMHVWASPLVRLDPKGTKAIVIIAEPHTDTEYQKTAILIDDYQKKIDAFLQLLDAIGEDTFRKAAKEGKIFWNGAPYDDGVMAFTEYKARVRREKGTKLVSQTNSETFKKAVVDAITTDLSKSWDYLIWIAHGVKGRNLIVFEDGLLAQDAYIRDLSGEVAKKRADLKASGFDDTFQLVGASCWQHGRLVNVIISSQHETTYERIRNWRGSVVGYEITKLSTTAHLPPADTCVGVTVWRRGCGADDTARQRTGGPGWLARCGVDDGNQASGHRSH